MSIKPYVLAQSLIFWSNIVFMMLAMFYDSLVFNCIFMLINLLITVIELTQLFSDFRIYFADPWNYLDQLRLILCFTVGILDLMDKNDINLTFVLVLINFTRGLTYFRAFDMTRFYVRLIIIAIKDSVSFLVIFLYSTLAFGVIYAATYGDSDLISVWKQSYELNMGNFSNDDYSILQYTCFTLATLINVVVMLNLLISILGDSFEKFQNTAKEIDLKEMLNVIIEFETMMF